MEFDKKSIYMDQLRGKTVTQVTFDQDFNVPDNSTDMERIIIEKGRIKLEEPRITPEQARVRGQLEFVLLYGASDSGKPESIRGELPFDEPVNIEGLGEKSQLQVQWEIEDLTAEMINARKYNVKAIVTLILTDYQMESKQVILQAEGEDEFESLYKNLDVTQTALHTRDTWRLKEEIDLPSSQPNINKILFENIDLRSCTVKPLDGKLSFRGELVVFCIYTSAEEHIPVQWVERQISVAGNLELPDSMEEMIASVDVRLQNPTLTVEQDSDGENRILAVEAVLDFDVILYEEVNVRLLADAYSPVKEMATTYEPMDFDILTVKNNFRYRVTGRMDLDTEDKVLQICHCDGSIKIDDTVVTEEGMTIEGALCVTLLYICANDREPFRKAKGVIPFTCTAQAPGLQMEDQYKLQPSFEQISAIMTDSAETELKAAIIFDFLAFKKVRENVLTDITPTPLSMEKMEKMPGIIGYIVQPGDTLWSVAKKFYASVGLMKEINEITGEEIHVGDRLIIVKSSEEMMA